MQSDTTNKAPSRRLGLLFGAAVATLAGAGAAHAQQTQAPPAQPEATAEEDGSAAEPAADLGDSASAHEVQAGEPAPSPTA